VAGATSGLATTVGRQHRARHLAAWRFQALTLALGLAFLPLALLAHELPYFPFDPPISRALQALQAPWLSQLLSAVGWIGFPPQSNIIFGSIILILFLARQRLEALGLLVAAGGSAVLWFQVAPLVARPRPALTWSM
jgi:hypothetical protein